MRKIILLAFVAVLTLVPLTALAHDGEDTLDRLLDAGMSEEQALIIAEHFDELDTLQELYYGDDHNHGDGTFWSETWALLTDPAHWVIEGAAELAFLAFNLIIFDRLIHRHRQGRHTLEGDK